MILLFLFSCLFQEETIINDKAKLRVPGIEAIASYLNQRNQRIAADIQNIAREAAKNQKVEGLAYQGEVIIVNGANFPDLIRIEDLLKVFTSCENPEILLTFRTHLLHRGFRLEELDRFLLACQRNSYTAYIKEYRQPQLEMKAKVKPTPAEVIRFYQEREKIEREGAEAWAASLLETISVPSRRSLLSYLFEEFAPGSCSHYKTVTPTQKDLEDFWARWEQKEIERQ